MSLKNILYKILPRHLHQQLMLLTALALLITLVIFTTYSAKEQSRISLSSFQNQAFSLARNIATSSASTLLVRDYDLVEELLLKSADFPDVLDIQVSDMEGGILSHVIRTPGQTAKPDFSRVKFIQPAESRASIMIEPPGHPGKMVIWHPIVSNGQLGWVRIYFDVTAQNEIQKRIWISSAFAGTLAIMIITALLSIFLRSPLQAIEEARKFTINMKFSATGNQLPPFYGPVEIEDLRNALNETSTHLFRQEETINAGFEMLQSHGTRLNDALQFTQQLIEVIPYPIYFQDVEGHYLGFNKAFETFWGIERDEWMGKTAYDLLPRDMADMHHEMDQQLLRDTGTQSYEAQVQAADNKIHDTIYEKASFVRADGSVAGLIGVISDITDIKHAAAASQRAAEAAEASNQAKSNFLANMSHEIRTPMNGIIGMTELTLETELNPEQREYLGMVKSSADALLTIINDILDFSKIEAGKMGIEDIPFSLSKTLNETIKTLSLRATQKGLRLDGQIPPDVPEHLTGDPGRLRQILTNLIGNAIKFTERGEIIASVKVEHTEGSEVFLHFSIRDTGIGIPEDKQKDIFEAFAQADGSITRKYGGTGLGLSITTRLVEMMHGKIWVESEPGLGSTFHFTARFGLSAETGQEAKNGVAPQGLRTHLSILLVEDNPINQRLAIALLEKAGHLVTVANNGREALETLALSSFDLVLMDMQMPEMDGIEATRRIRALEMETDKHQPIIAMTANAMQGDRERCLEAGMDDYISKPIQTEQLFATIDSIMQLNDSAKGVETRIEASPSGPFDYASALAQVDRQIVDIIGAMFLEEIPQYLGNIEDALNQGVAKDLQRAAHTLKGLLGNFGAGPAIQWALKIEKTAEAGKVDEARQQFVTLRAEMDKFQPALAAFIEAASSTGADG